jgi:eukaryotic-like serine/threonine-protein kinase
VDSNVASLPPGTKLGRYELLARIGSGGMGAVYAARAIGPGRFKKRMAVKRIHAHLATQREFVDMFLDEARIAAALHHANVAQVFDLGEHEGEFFIAMEYLHGEHLGAVSARHGGPLDPVIAARIVALAAEGLHYAHEASDEDGNALHLVHRDVSPQNIFVTYGGDVKVTDFGIARAEGRLADTHSGRMKGKTGYLAPEQVLGDAVDRRADVFSLGVVLYEITTGVRLFAGATDAEALFRIANHTARDPRNDAPDYPAELAAIAIKALEKFPEDRFATAGEMARALEDFVARTEKSARKEEIARLMGRLFDTEKRLKDRAFAGASETTPSGGNIDALSPTEPALARAGASTPSLAEVRTGERARPSRAAPIAFAIAAVLSVALAYLLMRDWLEPDAPVPTGADQSARSATRDAEPSAGEIQRTVPIANAEPRDAGRARDAGSTQPIAEVRRPEKRARPAFLSIMARPWATVRINGREIGRTPLADIQVPAGRIRMEARRQGVGEPYRETFEMRPGQHLSKRIPDPE